MHDETAPGEVTTVGVDVGGTKTLAVLLRCGAGSTAILDEVVVPSEGNTSRAPARIEEAVETLLARAPAREAPPRAVGVGTAGFVDLAGVVRAAPNTAGLIGVDIGTRLRELTHLPVVVDNDANCAAIAAQALVAPDARMVVAVTLGTGIGGGFIMQGRPLRGAHGFAAEPGHMVIDPDGPLCACGQRGCWEQYASGTGLARLARDAASQGGAASILERAGSLDGIRGEHVAELLADGDPAAAAVFEDFCGYVAWGVANLIMLVDPDVVVISGGLSELGDDLVGSVRRVLHERFPTPLRDREVQVIADPQRSDAGVVGAALLAASLL